MTNLPRATRRNETSFRLTSHALVVLMLTCAGFTLLSLVEHILPDRPLAYLPLLCFFGALERLYTYKSFKRLTLFSREWAIALLSEWVVITLLVRLVISLSGGLGGFFADLPRWFSDFSHYFLSPDLLLALTLMLIIWQFGGIFAGLLDEMDLSQALRLEVDPGQERGQPPARERLLNLIFSLGTALVVLTALVRVDMGIYFEHATTFSFTSMPALAGGGASTLLYFMIGLALLSQTRFIDLHTRWSVQRIPVSHQLGRSWALYSLGFLTLIAVLVALLPTRYSLEPLGLLGIGLRFITNLLLYLAQALLALLVFLISLPMLLLGRDPGSAPLPEPSKLPEIEALTQAVANPAWWEAAKNLVFWALLLAVLLFALTQYLRQHGEILSALRQFVRRAGFGRLWRWLRRGFSQTRAGFEQVLQAGRERLRRVHPGAPATTSGYISTRNLDPRQKITFFYLALLRRGAEKGLPRHPSQTPYEYASSLDAALPDAEDDIDALTQAFITARYSPRPVQPEQVNLVKSTWERLRKALRRQVGRGSERNEK